MLTLFGVRSTPVLPQWHVKDSGHPAKSAGCRLHLNTHTPLTQCSRGRLTVPLSRHSVGTYQETNSHATRQVTLSHIAHWRRFKIRRQASTPRDSVGRATYTRYQRLYSHTSNTHTHQLSARCSIYGKASTREEKANSNN